MASETGGLRAEVHAVVRVSDSRASIALDVTLSIDLTQATR